MWFPITYSKYTKLMSSKYTPIQNMYQSTVVVRIWCSMLNSLRPRRNRRLFADNIFKCIFVNENARISIKISLKFVPKGRINNIPALVQIMAWRRPGDKPLSETMMVNLPTHICVSRPQWVKPIKFYSTKCVKMSTGPNSHGTSQ